MRWFFTQFSSEGNKPDILVATKNKSEDGSMCGFSGGSGDEERQSFPCFVYHSEERKKS